MFIDLFFLLRQQKIPVSTTEWLTLMKALGDGHGGESLMGFYYLCRAVCVKSESLYDAYDQVFAYYFQGIEIPEKIKDEIYDWLKNAKTPDWMKLAQQKLRNLDLEQLRKEFEQRLKEQKERHDGGNHWIGTGGTSPFGHGGHHPGGLRVGGPGMHGSAAQIAEKRRFANLRKDRILDTRSIGLALKRLKNLGKNHERIEFDLDATIQKTAKNAGDVEVVFKSPKENKIKLLLLMDVGGSMTAYSRVCERLFSAANAAHHFKEFRYFYFHNCVYDHLFQSFEDEEVALTSNILKNLDSSWNLLVVGDAAMHPFELTRPGGAIDFFYHNELPGLEWLKKIRKRWPKSAWINPEPPSHWEIPSNQLIRGVFKDMFPMTMAGLEDAISHLNRKNQKQP